MPFPLAHLDDLAASPAVTTIIAVASVAVGMLLFVEHSFVKHEGLGPRQIWAILGVFVAVSLGVLGAPLPGLAQSSAEPVGLPDLISDPPSFDRTRDVRTPAGDVIRVLAFDGYIHNIGTGKLEVSGNPQVEGGMQQRVFDGESWQTVGTPTVRFETDDGHNHFHLIRAMDYALWRDDRTEPVTDSAKVGFCLVDTEQIEEGYASNYLLTDFNYCGVDEPDATELIMGITPGWRDTYDANVTLQWIDISNTQPGRYWLSAITDPNNEIVESNEDNNDIVYSESRAVVDGYVARALPAQTASEPIQLKSNVYGIVGPRSFVISAGPSNGQLDVPTGVDLLATDMVRYTPDAGFTGTDTFTYYAHDVSSLFPHDPTLVEVTVQVERQDTTATPTSGPEGQTILDPGAQQVERYEQVELGFELGSTPDPAAIVQWYAAGLPPGLSIDAGTGVLTGVPTFVDTFDSTIVAVIDAALFEQSVTWEVLEKDSPSLAAVGPISSSSAALLRLPVGAGSDGATYRGVGLPEGGTVVPNLPMLTGVGREVGTFQVRVEELIDDEVINSVEIQWTVRPSTRPRFPL